MTTERKQATVTLENKTSLKVEVGANLRKVLKEHFDVLYHPTMRPIHCRGFGTCGTCAVQIEGAVSEPTAIEKWRLNFPPHNQSINKGLRLACQVEVLGDISVTKKDGLWGQKTEK